MKKLLHSRTFYIVAVLLIIGFVVVMMFNVQKNRPEDLITTTVATGVVQQLVSVSGIAEAEQNAELAFPVTGIVQSVTVAKGDIVKAGEVLITLESQALNADRQDALADIARADADRDELLAGPTGSARDVTEQTFTVAVASLEAARTNEARKVENARRTLFSSDLTASSDDAGEAAVAPVITGTYTCDTQGTYTLDVFSSGTDSGYSYRLSGIESGTYPASTKQAVELGTCGLRAEFDANSKYSSTVWHIDIPNITSNQYVTNRNAYALSITQAESAIANAEQAVVLAQANATNQNAPARSEAVRRADAAVSQAFARLARIDATINDRVLRAPFAGTVTEIDILPGETVGTAPVVTLLADADFEITARIPEIDIGKIALGQAVNVVFDARSTDTLTGAIDFISVSAVEIDGVAYYEAIILLEETPEWLRSGLNADIDIIIAQADDFIRIPRRFLTTNEDNVSSVLLQTGEATSSTTVAVILEGNDGFVAITGLNEADIIVAP